MKLFSLLSISALSLGMFALGAPAQTESASLATKITTAAVFDRQIVWVGESLAGSAETLAVWQSLDALRTNGIASRTCHPGGLHRSKTRVRVDAVIAHAHGSLLSQARSLLASAQALGCGLAVNKGP